MVTNVTTQTIPTHTHTHDQRLPFGTLLFEPTPTTLPRSHSPSAAAAFDEYLRFLDEHSSSSSSSCMSADAYPHTPTQQLGQFSDFYDAHDRPWADKNQSFSPYAVAQTSPQQKARQQQLLYYHQQQQQQQNQLHQHHLQIQLQQQQHRRALSASTASTASPQHVQYPFYPTPQHTPGSDMVGGGGSIGAEQQPIQDRRLSQHDAAAYSRSAFFTGHPIPHLEPSMTQAMADELYAPSVGAPAPQYGTHVDADMLQPPLGMQQRLQEAHQARSTSPPDIKRETSPYRQGSQFAQDAHYQTAAGQRQRQKWEDDRYQQWRHHTRGQDPREPRTISPKDAYVDDFHDPTEEAAVTASGMTTQPLFATSQPSSQQSLFDEYRVPPSSQGQFQFQAPSVGSDFQYGALGTRNAPASSSDSSDDTPTHLVSLETTRSENDESESDSDDEPQTRVVPVHHIKRKPSTDVGTYSCTYIGCPRRFASPQLLQKHKRDFHRSLHPREHRDRDRDRERAASSAAAAAQASAALVPDRPDSPTQHGPHRCDRINPQTGRPCSQLFSRPYDLTRHEDTIHARKPKIHCRHCAAHGEEKTFSRQDALTRHLRVVHPDVASPAPDARKRR